MRSKILSILLAVAIMLSVFPTIFATADAIELNEKKNVTLEPNETSEFDFAFDEACSGDYVIWVENSDSIKVGYAADGVHAEPVWDKCYMQIKGTQSGTIIVENPTDTVQSCTICVMETAPVESFAIGNIPDQNALGWIGRVVGGDAYAGDDIFSTIYLSTTILPVNHEDCFVEKWISSDESVATVSSSGEITPLQTGTTTITAYLNNGMTSTYDYVVAAPEVLHSGYQKTITINPGELCHFQFDPQDAGEYVFYYESSVLDNLRQDIPEYLQGYFSSGCHMPEHADYGTDHIDYNPFSDFIMDYYLCYPGQQPYIFCCENMMIFEDGERIKTDPITLTVHFDKTVPVESITLSEVAYDGFRWTDNELNLYVDSIEPFLARHEEFVWESSDDTILKINDSDNESSNIDCLSPGTAMITVTSESGASTSLAYTVYDPFISGENTQWAKTSSQNLVLELNSNIADTLNMYLDEYWISPKNYTVTQGSTDHSVYIALHQDYLQSLDVGTHELLIFGTGGEATTTLTVLEHSSDDPSPDPTPTDPVPTDPAPTDPVPTDPAPADPVPTDPAPTAPVPTDPVPTDPVPEFTDVVSGSFYEDAVDWAVENEITNGTTATTFAPMDSCVRAQVVTFLWRAFDCPEPASLDTGFTDVPADAYYAKAVAWAVENGITNGMSETIFGSDQPCTRGQVATFLWRAAQKPAASGANPFADVAFGAFYYEAVLWAVSENITNGTSADTFSPDATCNRAQIVTFLYRYMTE